MAAPPPAGAATARKATVVRSPRSERRPSLRIVGPSRRWRRSGQERDGSRLLKVISAVVVVASLLVVVVGQAMLANGQVRMAGIQHQLALEQASHRQSEAAVSVLEQPSRIVAAATGSLGMVHPSTVAELPYVSLNTPLPTPNVTPAPASGTSTSTTAPPKG